MYLLYIKNRKWTLILGFIFNIIIELIYNALQIDEYLYSSSIFRFTFLIILGFYLFEKMFAKNAGGGTYTGKRTEKIIFIIGNILSIIYLIYCNFGSIPYFIDTWKRQMVFSNFYQITLVFILIKLIPNKFYKFNILGKASYHIFLTQMVWFSVNPFNKYNIIIKLIVNILVCVFAGICFYKFDNKTQKLITEKLKNRNNNILKS